VTTNTPKPLKIKVAKIQEWLAIKALKDLRFSFVISIRLWDVSREDLSIQNDGLKKFLEGIKEPLTSLKFIT